MSGEGKLKKTKHYKIRLNFVKQLLKLQIIQVEHIGTIKMIADVLTKALSEKQHTVGYKKK